jgi:hypothetical protein
VPPRREAETRAGDHAWHEIESPFGFVRFLGAAHRVRGTVLLDMVQNAAMSTQDLVVVQTFRDRFAARIAKTALDAAGIDSLIRSDDEGGLQPGMAFINGVELVVRAEDVARAGEVLKTTPRNTDHLS